MKQPVLLCYNLSGEKMQKIRLAAMRLKIRVRPVEKDEYAQTVAALCGLEEKTDAAYVGAGFEDEMLVMANFPAGMMNAFLGLFRRMALRPWRSRRCSRRPTPHGTAKNSMRKSRANIRR